MSVLRVAHAALFVIAVGATAVVSPLAAQDSSTCACRPSRPHEPSDFARRSSGSIAFVQSRPMGALGSNIGFGYGADGAYLFRLDQRGVFSLRANVGIVDYGNESKRVPLSPTVGGRIQVRVSTNNYIVPMSIGPQLTWPTGSVRPYVNAGLGGQAFYTESHIDGADDDDDFAHTTNQSDFTSTWSAGGGVYIPVYEKRTKVMLDLGVQYYNGGEAQYLRPGSITDLPNLQIQITPLQSTTHVLLARVGVRVGL